MPTDEDAERAAIATVRPPDGQEDPYGAPTRVARVPDTLLDQMAAARDEMLRAEAPRHKPPVPPRAPPARPQLPAPDAAASNELSALAAAASHAVIPRTARAARDANGVVPPSAPGAGMPVQSGHTVPLSSALLASVIKSVEDKRSAAAAAPASAPAPAPASPVVRTKRPRLALVLILAIGLAVFVTGVAMFLDAVR